MLNYECKEKYIITYAENSNLVPVVKYSYYMSSGTSLYSSDDGYTVTDDNFLFSFLDTNNY